jgi:restriction endonuclease Mrr
MSDAELLDELSGFEFEDLMEDVFRNLGYEHVRQAERVADKGRDIIMEEVVDGTRRAIIVECKHTDSVSRPVVQKLHSAVATFDFDGPKRGMVVTTGRFTAPAREYAENLRDANDPHPVELLDGTDLREIADEIGLDLYNGRIEIICDESLRPVDPTSGVDAPIRDAFRDIENIDSADVPRPQSSAEFQPVVMVSADVNAVFETSVGVIHRINERDRFVVHATRGHPEIMEGSVRQLIEDNHRHTTEFDERTFAAQFDEIEIHRFGQTETEYKDWAVNRLQDRHTTTVSYTGDNNVTYTKTCEPNQSDIAIQAIEPVYLPHIRQTVHLGEYVHSYEYYAAGPSRVTTEDGIHRCDQCQTSGQNTTYTYCENCGSINCPDHIKTERLEGRPVCTGCAVTERFFFKTKYFYDEANRDDFRAEYEQMPLHEKARENPPLIAGFTVATVLLILLVLSGLGLI